MIIDVASDMTVANGPLPNAGSFPSLVITNVIIIEVNPASIIAINIEAAITKPTVT